MNIEQCITILTQLNKWRRGDKPYENGGEELPYSGKELGEAIDFAIEELHRLKGLEK